MPLSVKIWWEKLVEGWPQLTRLQRLTAYFAGLDLFLFVAWRISALFSTDSSLGGWFRFVGYLTIFFGLLVIAGLVLVGKTRMWRAFASIG